MITEVLRDPSNPKKRVLMGTPHYDERCYVIYTRSMLMTQWPEDFQVTLVDVIGAPTGRAVNLFAQMTLDGGFDYFVWACNDGGWRPDAVKRLLSHDKDVVTGWSSMRFHPFEVKAFISIDRERVTMRYRKGIGTGLERVYSIAGELAVYKADVFRRVQQPWFTGINKPDGEPTSDDFAFGCKAYDAGVEIWLDWDVPLRHAAAGMVTEGGHLRAL